MKFKKKKYRFTPPDKIVQRAEPALPPPGENGGSPRRDPVAAALPDETAARLLHTAELNRAELLGRIDRPAGIPSAAETPSPAGSKSESKTRPLLEPKSESKSEPKPRLAPAPARSREEEARRAALLCDLAIDLRQILERKKDEPLPFHKRLFSPPNFAFAALAAVFLAPVFLFAHGDKSLYYLHENGALAAVAYTASDAYADIFASGGLALDPADAVDSESLGSITHLTVTRSYAVTVTADGETRSLNVLGHTVAEALDQLGIPVGENDLAEPALDTVLAENDAIAVRRVT